MESNRLRSRARLHGICRWRCSLLLAFCLLSLPAACKRKHHHVNLTWKAPTSSPVPVVGYRIYRSADGGATYAPLNSTPIKETTYPDWVIQNGRTYRYQVRSVDAHGNESVPSNMVDVTVPK